jgi:hypothetical protein
MKHRDSVFPRRPESTHDVLRKLACIAQHEVTMCCSEIKRERTSKPLLRLLLEGSAFQLVASGCACEPAYVCNDQGERQPRQIVGEMLCQFNLGPDSQHVQIAPDTMNPWIIVPDTPQGHKWARKFNEYTHMEATYAWNLACIFSVEGTCVTLRVRKFDPKFRYSFPEGEELRGSYFVIYQR